MARRSAPGADTTTFFGADRAEAVRRIGSLGQVARVEQLSVDDGPGRGTRRIRVVTGGGLDVDLLPDRSLDLGQVTVHGVPVAWISPVGLTAPAFYDDRGTEWLRTFGGGLLATCGLDTFGPPSVDDGVAYPMHGRVGAIPATVTGAGIVGEQIVITGEVRQTTVFGDDLVLHRRITAPLGGTSLAIEDTVSNAGFAEAGHMVLYHVNLGWPLLSETASLSIPARSVTPRDAAAEAGVARWQVIDAPIPGYAEQVFLHDLRDSGTAVTRLENPAAGIRFELRQDTATLPSLHQWKMTGEGHYVLGLEPANVGHIQGRASARAAGVLPILGAGESVTHRLEFAFSTTTSERGQR